MLIIAETVFFLVLLALVFKFKILSKPILGEKEIGPFNVVYKKHIGSPWSVPKEIKDLQNYMKSKGVKSDTYVCVYIENPTKVSGNKLKSIIGCVVEGNIPKVEEPYEITTLNSRYVAYASSENRIPAFNKSILYPRLFAYMNIMNYKPASEQFIEIFHLGEGKYGFGKGFRVEVCSRIRPMTEEEILNSEEDRPNYNEMIYGGKGRFGRL